MQYESLLTDIELNVFGASDAAMLQAVRSTVAEFLHKTLLYRHRETIAATSEQAVYTVPLPVDTACVEFIDVFFDGRELQALTDPILEPDLYSGQPRYFYRSANSEITLYPTPHRDGSLHVESELRPSHSADGVALEELESLFREYIVAGACARLLRSSGKEWYDPVAAREYQTLYATGVIEGQKHSRRYRSKPKTTVGYGGY